MATHELDGTTPMISADSHVIEPHDLWARKLPPEMAGKVRAFPPPRVQRGMQQHLGAQDPVGRLDQMRRDGVVAEVLYPTLGGELFRLNDWALQEHCFRIYNDYLIEYCSHANDRLLGVAMISAFRPGAAIVEMTRCREAGLRGVLFWERPHPNLPFYSMHYKEIWAAAQDLDMPINFHITTEWTFPEYEGSADHPSLVTPDLTRVCTNWRVAAAIETLYELIFYGILNAYPKLKVSFVEYEMGWAPFMLQQWDRYHRRFKNKMVGAAALPEDPSTYFINQVFCTILKDPVGAQLAMRNYPGNCLWSNDFPHPESTWPNAREYVKAALAETTPDVREKILWKNAASLFGIDMGAVLAKLRE